VDVAYQDTVRDCDALAGDVDLSIVGAALADPGRAKMLLALADGRALPASVLAAEAGVKPSTASVHLERLLAVGLIKVEPHGRYRYFRLAGTDVARLVETVARLSPPQPVQSLREGTRAQAVRLARRCYDHLAGRLAVAITDRLIEDGCLTGGDGSIDIAHIRGGRLSGGVGDDTVYHLTDAGQQRLSDLGVALPIDRTVRCCIDWSEQRHHLAGALGRNLLSAFTDASWLYLSPQTRAVVISDTGRATLATSLGIAWPPPHGAARQPAA
jgi:DNA-binding transcriptional ArsR family regulator